MSRDYTKLRAWQLSDELVVRIYKETKNFPKSELFALTSQMRRAAVSVPGNIAEGSGRKSQKEYLHFLHIAFSSLTELGYYIGLSKELGYWKSDKCQELKKAHGEITKVLQGLIKRINKDLRAKG